ncbi:MAG: EAL domain-containing protein [Myxococcota bacterium]
MIEFSFAIAATALSLIGLSSWRVGKTPIGRAYLTFVVSTGLWAAIRLASAKELVDGAGVGGVGLAFALIGVVSQARLASFAQSGDDRLPNALEWALWGSAAFVWLIDDRGLSSMYASLLLASASVRLLGMPRRSWDGFVPALWSVCGTMMTLALLPLLWLVGVPEIVGRVSMPLTATAVGVALLYGLPRLGLLSTDRVQHGRVIQAMTDGVLVVDLNGRLVDFNEAAGEILELDDQARVVRPLEIALAHHPDLVELFSGAIDGRSLYAPQSLAAKGEPRTFDLQLSALYDVAGAIESRILVLRDISDRIEIERENRRQAKHVRLVHEVSAAVHEAQSIDAGIEAALALVANTMEVPLGQFLRSVDSEDGSQLVASGIVFCGIELEGAGPRDDSAKTIAETLGERPGAFRAAGMQIVDPRGANWWKDLGFVEAFSVPVLIGPRLFGMFEFFRNDDVDTEASTVEALDRVGELVGRAIERKLAEEKIRRLAFRDDLTGLPNRQRFHHLLRGAVSLAARSDRRMALLFLDLDGFKKVNDTLGHEVGDRLLAEVASRFSRVVRISDHIGRQSDEAPESAVSRLGGDEFTVLLTEIKEPGDAALVAERLLQTLEAPVVLNGREVFMGTSIGIAVFPDDASDTEELLRNADAAMYFAKGRGRNGFQFYSEEMNASQVAQIEIEGRLRGALDRDEFQLHYQPILDAESGEIVAAEALLRWVDGERGMVPPDQFVPVAEETGLIVPIGQWVFHTACEQAQRWKTELGRSIRIGVNVSGFQIREPGMLEMVRRVIEETGVDPHQVELELTESTIMQDDALTVHTLGEFREMGIGLALDDFGTGYSSLSYLRRFTIDRVKIDRSFVSELPDNPDDAALTSAILAMAHGLRLQVVAEGVETTRQALFLRARGCDEVQGYLFGRPSPPEEFFERLQARPVPIDNDAKDDSWEL